MRSDKESVLNLEADSSVEVNFKTPQHEANRDLRLDDQVPLTRNPITLLEGQMTAPWILLA